MKRTGIALGLGLALTCSLCAQGPEIAWEENFDDPNCLSNAQFYVSHANNQQAGWNDGLLIKELKDGVVRYGVRPDKSRIRDYVHLAYGNVSGQIAPPWGPFDLNRYPIVEIKWRGSFLEIDYDVETASGKKHNDYVQWVGDPNEWTTTVWRVATDTSVPGPETAVKLLGIDPLVRVCQIFRGRVRRLVLGGVATRWAIGCFAAGLPRPSSLRRCRRPSVCRL